MRTTKYTQHIQGKVKSIVLMPTYGTSSWLFNEQLKLGLPKTILRNQNENIGAFYRRVQGIENKINEKIRKHVESSVTGIWQKENKLRTRQIHHNYVESELKR